MNMEDWVKQITTNKDLMGMGHSQSASDNNLGFGWVYYGLARAYRPRHVVCIGSYRGFVPMMFAKALADNAQGGHVTFIDPSFVDDFWTRPDDVKDWFAAHDLRNISHYKMTTEEFVGSTAYNELPTVDFLFVDGFHSDEHAEYEHRSFQPKLAPNGLVFFHDSVTERTSKIYGESSGYEYSVCRYIQRLKRDPEYQVIDFPFSDGLTLVRRNIPAGPERQPDHLYADINS